MLETYRTAVFGFEALRPEEQVTQMGQVGKTCMQELLVYMDARRPVFRLILQGAEGTPYAGLIDELATARSCARSAAPCRRSTRGWSICSSPG